MKHADDLKTAWTALCHAIVNNATPAAKASTDELAALTAINVIQDAAGATTQPQDMVILQYMKKYCTAMNDNYT